jgi:hypothetical protein
VHHGLSRAFDILLRGSDFSRDNPEASFKDKAKEVLPSFYWDCDLARLADQRNWYAHPEYNFYHKVTDTTIRDTAKEFVELILAAWPVLFNRSAPYAAIEHPKLASQENILKAPQVKALRKEMDRLRSELESIQRKEGSLSRVAQEKDAHIDELQERVAGLKARLRPRIPKPRLPDLPWRKLALGLLLLPLPMLFSLALHLWAASPEAWAWPVTAGVAALVLCFFGLLNLARFLRAVGLLRLIAALAIALLAATVLVLPTTDPELRWADRSGSSLTRVLDSIGEGVYSYTSACAGWGGELAEFIITSPDVSAPAVQSTRSAAPTATKGTKATSTPTSRPTSTATRTP